VVAGIGGSALPFAGEPAAPLPITASRDPLAVAETLWHALAHEPALLVEALVLAVLAAALPLPRRAPIAGFGVLLLAGVLAPNPALPDAAVVVATAATCLGLAARGERYTRGAG
ncbi:MAG TPA: hypothetical protein VE269_02930, partial [Gaiellaceae bacterium]|nr:hypothetical protein [Gaiellaceae bacterium]